jgi:hypothetical protein
MLAIRPPFAMTARLNWREAAIYGGAASTANPGNRANDATKNPVITRAKVASKVYVSGIVRFSGKRETLPTAKL